MVVKVQPTTYNCHICGKTFETKASPLCYENRSIAGIDKIFFCNFKHRAYHYFKLGQKDIFELDLKFYYKSDSQRNELEKRFATIKKLFVNYERAIREWINTLETVSKFFKSKKFETSEKRFIEKVFLGHSFEMLELLRTVKRERRLKKMHVNEIIMVNEKIIEFDNDWIKMRERFPLIFTFENVQVMGYYLRFLEIKLKKEFQANIPFDLILESISKLNN